MADPPAWRYYAALFASLVSTLAWVGVALGGGYVAYAAATDAPTRGVTPFLVAVLLVVAIGFARVERLLYRREQS